MKLVKIVLIVLVVLGLASGVIAIVYGNISLAGVFWAATAPDVAFELLGKLVGEQKMLVVRKAMGYR